MLRSLLRFFTDKSKSSLIVASFDLLYITEDHRDIELTSDTLCPCEDWHSNPHKRAPIVLRRTRWRLVRSQAVGTEHSLVLLATYLLYRLVARDEVAMESLPETAYISVKILIGNRCIQCIRSVGYLRSQREQPLITIVVPTHDDKAFPLLVKFLQNFLVGIGHSSVHFLLRKRHRSDHFQENIAEMMIEFLLYFFDFLQRFFWENTYKIPPYYSLAIANNSIDEKAKPIR